MVDKSAIAKNAQMYASKGQIDKAIAEWETLLKTSPDGNTFNIVGDLYLRKKAKVEAIEAFSKAANIFKENGFYLKAIALYKKILHISPLEVTALVSLGELNAEKGLIGNASDNFSAAAGVYLKEGLTEKALEVYEKALQFTPSDINLKLKIIELYLQIGLKEEAAKKYLSIASDHLEKGEQEKAHESYLKTLDCDPHNVPAFIGIGRMAEDSGDINRAYEYLAKALSFAFNNQDVLFHFARLALATGKTEDARQALIKLIELEPSNNHYKKLLGSLYLKEGDLENSWKELHPYIDEIINHEQWEESLGLLKHFENIAPIEVRSGLITTFKGMNDNDSAIREMKALSGIYEGKNLLKEAVLLMREVLELNSSDKEARARIKVLENKLGIEEVPPEVSLKGESYDEILSEADEYMRQGLLREAAGLLKRLTIKEPGNAEFHMKLKDVYVEAGETDMAVDECIVIAGLHEESGDIEAKKTIITEALGLNPENQRVIAISKDLDIEAPAKEEAVSRAVSEEGFEEKLAEADFYAQQGLREEAVKLYQELLIISPGHAELKKKLDSLMSAQLPGVEEKEQEITQAPLDNDLRDIFHEFKKGIDKELGEKDGESRYNLGIAYKEMGLLDDAIKEFKIAAKDPAKALRSSSMLALCYMEKSLYPLAIEEFKKVAALMPPSDSGYIGVKCDLADAHVKNKEFGKALEIYNEIYARDPKFRDVERKIQIIKSMIPEEKDKPKTKKDRVSYI